MPKNTWSEWLTTWNQKVSIVITVIFASTPCATWTNLFDYWILWKRTVPLSKKQNIFIEHHITQFRNQGDVVTLFWYSRENPFNVTKKQLSSKLFALERDRSLNQKMTLVFLYYWGQSHVLSWFLPLFSLLFGGAVSFHPCNQLFPKLVEITG